MVSNSKSWARKNKRSFANKMITAAGVEPHDEPAAFFMAGLPGAGKTEFTLNIIQELGLKVVRIDMDEIATHIESYNPLKADAFREAASDMMNAVYDRTLHRRVDFIMDGTFRSAKSLDNIQRALKKGYSVKVFYISQDPEVAWSFTRAREKVEKRSIHRQGFISTSAEIFENLAHLDTVLFKDVTLDIVVKDRANKVGEWHRNVSYDQIDKLIGKRYSREELERMLAQ